MLEDFLKDTLAHSKEALEEKGSIPSLAYIWGIKSEMGPMLRNAMVKADTGENLTDDDFTTQVNMAILVVPCLYGDAKALFEMIHYLAPDEEERQLMSSLLAIGATLNIEDPYVSMVKGFKRAFSLHEKDIVAAFLKKVCADTQAVAIAKVDESWIRDDIKKVPGETIEQARERYPNGLENDPLRKEGIQIVIETKTFRIMKLVKFERASQDRNDPGYRQITWGEEDSIIDETVENQKATGRFLNILMPPKPSEPAEQTKSN